MQGKLHQEVRSIAHEYVVFVEEKTSRGWRP